MIVQTLIHTIYALRFIKAGYNDLNEPSFSSSSFVSNNSTTIPCRIETYQEKTDYNTSGQRVVNTTLIYVPSDYLLLVGDRIYVGSSKTPDLTQGQYLGKIVSVTPAILGFSTDIDHYEIKLENP